MDFRICIGGQWGGKIIVNSNYPNLDDDSDIGNVPANTCGIRWRNPVAWFWTRNNYFIDTLPNADFHPNLPELVFSGPYPGCRGGTYNFLPPLTSEGDAPFDLAHELVVQVLDENDVEYLDSNEAPIPRVVPPPPPPPPSNDLWFPPHPTHAVDICVAVPEICDTLSSPNPGDFHVRSEIFDAAGGLAVGVIRLHDLTAAVGTHVNVGRVILASASSSVERKYAQEALKTAEIRMALAQVLAHDVRDKRDEVAKCENRAARMLFTSQIIGNISMGIELGTQALSRCAKRLGDASRALTGSSAGVGDNFELAFVECRLAQQLFSNAMLETARLKAWALPDEMKKA